MKNIGVRNKKILDDELKYLFELSSDLPIYRKYSEKLSREELEDAVEESLLAVYPLLERRIISKSHKDKTVLKKEFIANYSNTLRNFIIHKKHVQRKESTLQSEEGAKVNLQDELTATLNFWDSIARDKPKLAKNLDFEMAFYLYVINEHLKDDEKIVVDAIAHGDQKAMKQAVQKVGNANYYRLHNSLFNKKGFHKKAIAVASKMLWNRGYGALANGSLSQLLRVIESLKHQLAEK